MGSSLQLEILASWFYRTQLRGLGNIGNDARGDEVLTPAGDKLHGILNEPSTALAGLNCRWCTISCLDMAYQASSE